MLQLSTFCIRTLSAFHISIALPQVFNNANGVVVITSALQLVYRRFISQSRVIPKDYKKWYSQLPFLALSTKGTVWSTSRQACLLCPWARHLTGRLHLYVVNRWWIEQSTCRGGPVLRKKRKQSMS